MSPKNKRVKVDHDSSNAVIETIPTKPEEPEWLLLEDLEAEDIDDEFGDMIIEQRLLVNNEVLGHVDPTLYCILTFI